MCSQFRIRSIIMLVVLCAIGCARQPSGKKLVIGPRPSVFGQVAGPDGTIDMQVFDKWVVIYEYPTTPHKQLGIAAKAFVHSNKGTRKEPQLGEKLAIARLVSPKTFKMNKYDYPRTPKEIIINEEHIEQGRSVYKGSLTFQSLGQISRRTNDTSLSGETSSDYFISWPMYNYFIEKQMQRGATKVWTINLKPKN